MAVTQLNTRMDESLRQSGDAVFKRYGYTPAEVVKSTWQYAAAHQEPPDFLRPRPNGPENDLDDAIERGMGMAGRFLEARGIRDAFAGMTFEDLRDAAYEEDLIEREEDGRA